MAKKSTHPGVDAHFRQTKVWAEELKLLRMIALDSPLTEELKWHQPCYTWEGNNVIILGGFKEFCTMSFFKGALLKDPERILEKAGEHTRAARIVRITGAAQVRRLAPVLRQYILEAIELEKAGKKFDFEGTRTFDLPAELVQRFKTDKQLQAAFQALTPGRQRGYVIFFTGAKQSATRAARIEKCRQRILEGKGLQG